MRGKKGKLPEHKSLEYFSCIGPWPVAEQVTRIHVPQFPHLLKQPNPHLALSSSCSEQRMALTDRCTTRFTASSLP